MEVDVQLRRQLMFLTPAEIADSPHVDREQVADQGLGTSKRETTEKDEEERWDMSVVHRAYNMGAPTHASTLRAE